MHRFSSFLPLLALVSLGMPGCSSTGEPFELLPAAPGDGGHEEGGQTEDEGETTGEDPGSGDGSDGDPSGTEPEPEPDDDGRGGALDEPAATCNLDGDVALWLSPDDSNAMASPVLVREAVLGSLGSVQSVAIRTWEFFNHYGFGYPAAEPGMLALHASLLQPAGAPAGELVLQVGVSSEHVAPEARAPIDVTLLLDTSGSMEGEAMEMLRETSYAIAASLRAGDVVSVVTWSTEDAVVLAGHAVAGPDDAVLLEKIDALVASGDTDLHAGLEAAYGLAQQSLAGDRSSRVVLVSDGSHNVDVADLELIAQHAGTADQEGTVLVGVGVGEAATYRDDLMDAVTGAGKGATVFVGDAEDAWTTFHDRFVSTMGVAARDVQVRLDMPPGFELVSTAVEASLEDDVVEPQHLAPDDAMVFHQRVRTCAPTQLASDATVTVTAIWIDAITLKPRQVQRVATVGELLAADPAPLLKGMAVHAYAEGLKAYKHADSVGRSEVLSPAFAALAQAEAVLPGDPELAEIRQVLEALAP